MKPSIFFRASLGFSFRRKNISFLMTLCWKSSQVATAMLLFSRLVSSKNKYFFTRNLNPKLALKHLFLLFLIVLGNLSCMKEQKLPIEDGRLIPTLCDVHIAEAALSKVNGTIKDTAAHKFYKQIYEIHGITEAELDSCLVLIKRDPVLSEKVYTKVMSELEKMKLVGK